MADLTDEQLADIELAKQEVREGKFASDEEMAEVWRLFSVGAQVVQGLTRFPPSP